MKPRVTVCLPVYNGERYLRQTIESALAQDMDEWVILASDNHSTDSTLALLREYEKKDRRITVFTQNENVGVSRNWQFLAERVETPFFCVLGADDLFAPNHLRRKLNLLEEHDQSPYAHGAVYWIDSE